MHECDQRGWRSDLLTAGMDWASIFPGTGNATIPTACMDPVAVDMLRFVPGANRPDGTYQAVPNNADNADQFTLRLDHRINDHQNFSFYYYYTDDKALSPFYNFQASGANIPGFGAKVGSRYQQFNPSHTWTITNSLINEFRFTYMREGQLTFQHPQTTSAVQDTCSSPAAQAVCFNGTSDSSAINAASRLVAPTPSPASPRACRRIIPVFLSLTFLVDSRLEMDGKASCRRSGTHSCGRTI